MLSVIEQTQTGLRLPRIKGQFTFLGSSEFNGTTSRLLGRQIDDRQTDRQI